MYLRADKKQLHNFTEVRFNCDLKSDDLLNIHYKSKWVNLNRKKFLLTYVLSPSASKSSRKAKRTKVDEEEDFDDESVDDGM